MNIPFFFDKPFRLSAEEKKLFLGRAADATASLGRNRKRDCFLGAVSEYQLLGGLATYAFLLRHLAAGRRARYFAPFHPAGCMAAFLGHADILRIFEARGIPLEALAWSWHKANILDFAVMGRHRSLVKELLGAHPALAEKKWRQDAVAYCVQHGTLPILRLLANSGASLVKSYWRSSPGARFRSPEGTPFFLAAAMGRKDMVRELIRLGAFPDWTHTGGTTAAHLSDSLLGLAIRNDDYQLADWLLGRGCTHDELFDLPADCFALDHLERFRYLCRIFPDEDYKSDVRKGGECVLSRVSREVLSFAWDGKIPEHVLAEWKKAREKDRDWRPGDPFPDDPDSLRLKLDAWPDELLRLEKEQPGRFRRLLLERSPTRWASLHAIVYLLRLAAAHGIAVFRGEEDKATFLEEIRHKELVLLRPHLAEFGLPPVSDADMDRLERKDWGNPKRNPRANRLRKLAAVPWEGLRAVLDIPRSTPTRRMEPGCWPTKSPPAPPRAFSTPGSSAAWIRMQPTAKASRPWKRLTPVWLGIW